jgi:hypothetical protein
MLEWIGKNMLESPEDLIEKLSALVDGDISKALEKFRVDKK